MHRSNRAVAPEGLVAFGEADPGLLAARPDMPGRSAAKIAASLRRTVLIFFECFSNGHISGALAELIRSTRAPTKDRLKGKIMSGGPVFRGTRAPGHMLSQLVPSRACARTRYRRGPGRANPLDPS